MNYDTFNEQDNVDQITWYDKVQITTSNIVEITNRARLFWRQLDRQQGFEFCCVEWVSNFADVPDWQNPTVEIIVAGCAYFDGLRHIWMPYVYYPEVDILLALFNKLKELEQQFCTK